MTHIVLRFGWLALLLLIVIPVGGAGLSEAQGQGNLNARLHGEYAFTQSRQCVESTAGFDADLRLNPIPPTGGFIRQTVNADRGSIRYNGDGTGTATSRTTLINTSVGEGFIPVSEAEAVCNLAYTVNPDGSVDQQTSCTFEVVAGAGVGIKGMVTGRENRRQIVQGNTALLHAPADEPVVETLTITSPTVAFPVRHRICVISGITAKVSPR